VCPTTSMPLATRCEWQIADNVRLACATADRPDVISHVLERYMTSAIEPHLNHPHAIPDQDCRNTSFLKASSNWTGVCRQNRDR
jgi:hypothetical protein